MNPNEQAKNANDIRGGNTIEDSLTSIRIKHVEFTVEGDEIDGRVFDISYLSEECEVPSEGVPLSVQAHVRARLELDLKVYDLAPKDGDGTARLRWDL